MFFTNQAHERCGQSGHSKHHQIKRFDQGIAAYLFEYIPNRHRHEAQLMRRSTRTDHSERRFVHLGSAS